MNPAHRVIRPSHERVFGVLCMFFRGFPFFGTEWPSVRFHASDRVGYEQHESLACIFDWSQVQQSKHGRVAFIEEGKHTF